MNIDHVLDTFNRNGVSCLLIGGMNFVLRHGPVLTYDIDLWVADIDSNLRKSEKALAELDATWGPTDRDWGPVSRFAVGWLSGQSVFCLTSPYGAIDVFRSVTGLGAWQDSARTALSLRTAAGVSYTGLCDEDMLRAQEALDEKDRDVERIAALRKILADRHT